MERKDKKTQRLAQGIIKITNGLETLGLKKLGTVIKKKVFKEVYEMLGGNIEAFFVGGGTVNPSYSRTLRDIGIQVIQGWGGTECTIIATVGNRENPTDSIRMAYTRSKCYNR